jgi:hypothetical protein
VNSDKEHAQIRREQFESNVIKDILRIHDLGRFSRDLCRYSDKELNLGFRLNAVSFHHFYPSFPIYFHTDVITKLAEDMKMSIIFGKVADSKLFRKYVDRQEDVPPEHAAKPFGLVFAWPRMGKHMILHNGPQHSEETKLQWHFKITEHRTNTMMMELLLPLLQTLEWEPTTGDYSG